jgi:hypothetical protein
MTILGVSRRMLWTQRDRPALRPLPATRYELATLKICRVDIDSHVEIDAVGRQHGLVVFAGIRTALVRLMQQAGVRGPDASRPSRGRGWSDGGR